MAPAYSKVGHFLDTSQLHGLLAETMKVMRFQELTDPLSDWPGPLAKTPSQEFGPKIESLPEWMRQEWDHSWVWHRNDARVLRHPYLELNCHKFAQNFLRFPLFQETLWYQGSDSDEWTVLPRSGLQSQILKVYTLAKNADNLWKVPEIFETKYVSVSSRKS